MIIAIDKQACHDIGALYIHNFMKDNLKEFLALREALVEEKEQLLVRLREIEAVLGEAAPPAPAKPRRGRPPGSGKAKQASADSPVGRRPQGGKRIRNKISLRNAIIAATKNRALTKQEILDAVEKMGYRFNAKNPIPSLNSVLYANQQFKRDRGKFSPA